MTEVAGQAGRLPSRTMNQRLLSAVQVAVPVERAWTVLGSPLSWPWLGGSSDGAARTEVTFLRREGDRAAYRFTLAGESCAAVVEHGTGEPGAGSATLYAYPDCPESDTASLVLQPIPDTPGAPVLAWSIAGDGDEAGRFHWEVDEAGLPGPLAELWARAPRFGAAVESWHRELRGVQRHPQPLCAASTLAPILGSRAPHSADARTLDAGVVAAIRASGLFRIGLPRALGGLDLPGRTIVTVIEELSRADAAAGWCTFIGNQSAYASWLPEAELAALSAEAAPGGGFVLAGSTAITGTGRPAGDGTYLLTGRWRFNSGCLHADWLMAGVSVPGADGVPVPMLAFLPWRDGTILGTWDVAGLAGTGSHDLALTDVAVPAARLAPLFTARSNFDDPLHRLSPYNIQAVLMSGLPLGIARRALDELCAIADDGATEPSPDDLVVDVARLEIGLAAARGLVLETIDGYWAALADTPHLDRRRESALALVLRNALDTAKHTVEAAVRLAGPDCNETLQRCLRDVYGAGQHLAVSDDLFERNAHRFLAEAPDAEPSS